MPSGRLRKAIDVRPPYLVHLFDAKKINNGREILARLLQDGRMRPAWKALTKRVDTDAGWRHLWGNIAGARHQAKRLSAAPQSRFREQKKYIKLSQDLRQLASEISNGALDVPSYQLIPIDSLRALGVDPDAWRDASSLDRSRIAHRLLPDWACASELLNGLADEADRACANAMHGKRPFERAGTKNFQERIFVWHLLRDFQATFNAPLEDSVARIATAVFDKGPGDELTREFVKAVRKNGVDSRP